MDSGTRTFTTGVVSTAGTAVVALTAWFIWGFGPTATGLSPGLELVGGLVARAGEEYEVLELDEW
jgi:hypothetical protein